MLDYKLIEKITQCVFALLVVSWLINAISQLHLFGMSEVYEIPNGIIYVLLALLGIGGSSKTIRAVTDSIRNKKSPRN